MSDVKSIHELLCSNDTESIREGARLAGEQQLEEAIPDLVSHLSSDNLGVQEASDRALRRIGGGKVVSAIIPLLDSDNASVRNISMDILRSQGHININVMADLLTGDDADLRIFAADILGSSGQELAVPLLSHALLHDPEVNVRYQSAISLGTLAFPSAAPSLNKALNDEEWVQFSAIEALTKLRVESSIDAMMKALDSCSDLVASTIIDALGEMRNIKAVPLLLQKLSSSPAVLCHKIVKAIVFILGENSLFLLSTKDQQRLIEYMRLALNDEDMDVQDAAIRGLCALNDKKAIMDILEIAAALNPEKYRERISFIENSLARMGVSEGLISGLRSNKEKVQRMAVNVASLTGDKSIPLELMAIFWNASQDTQRFIMEALSKLQPSPESQSFYLDIIERHTDSFVIREALSLLAKCGNVAGVEDSIIAQLKHELNDIKEAALEAAIYLGTPNVKEYFTKTIVSENLIDRLMATYALGQFGAEEYLEALKSVLCDESEEVRKVAVEAVGVQKPLSPERIFLVESMLKDPSKEVRMAAVDILGDVPGEDVDAHLIERLSDEDVWVQVRAIEKLGTRKSDKGTEALISKLTDKNSLVVIKSIGSLESIGGEVAFQALFGLLNHSDEEIQLHAANAMESIRHQKGE